MLVSVYFLFLLVVFQRSGKSRVWSGFAHELDWAPLVLCSYLSKSRIESGEQRFLLPIFFFPLMNFPLRAPLDLHDTFSKIC